MSSITKAQWEKLEKVMTYSFVDINFTYRGYKLSVYRASVSEGKTVLVVYINGCYKSFWGLMERECEDRPSIIKDVWKKRSMAKHKPNVIKSIEKIYGKRKAKKEYPDLHGRHEWYEPSFPKASVLCRQFKKLKGLELMQGGADEE